MGHRRGASPWDGCDDPRYQQHRANPWQGWAGAPGWGRPSGHSGPGGPPPWLQGLLGFGQPEPQGRSPRVRRGDVRTAILDILRAAGEAEDPVNGYQVIQQIAERSQGAWRPSPGSVYPTIQQLEDEGLVEADDERGRKTIRLTEAGNAYVADHVEELAAVWAPFDRDRPEQPSELGDVKSEIGQVLSAAWQIITQGSPAQRQSALGVLADTRRRLYGILADGNDPADVDEVE
jgi:DNA-binding PadR family transcriptional regulator